VMANYLMPVALSVEASGSGSLQYQWFKGSNPLPEQTGATLTIPAVTSSDAGEYHVSVTDENGTTVSSDATVIVDLVNIQPSAFDLWDSQSGVTISGGSEYGSAGGPYGMFGAVGEFSITYFADNQPVGTVHFVEWTTSEPVLVNTVRLFAHGDGADFAHSHEFDSITLKAKSPGSATFDILVGTFAPSHPYTLLDATTSALLDTEIAPVVATAFRAEFEQFTAGFGLDGPRIVELDAFTTRPLVLPAFIINPQSQTVSKNAAVWFQVLARGGNLQYQWKLDGKNMPGETSDTLLIEKAKKQDQGTYTVVVSNELGSVESSPASLVVSKTH
jgi:hypothetical protein